MGVEQQNVDNSVNVDEETVSNYPTTANLALRGKRVCVFGLQGFGKTYWAKYAALHYKSLVFDILGEFRDDYYYVIRPDAKQYGDQLLSEFAQGMQQYVFSKKYKWDMVVIDEANQYFPNGRPLPPEMARLNDFNRHMDLGIMCVARRPTQLHTDLTELAHYNIFFKLTGINDMKRLRDMHPGLDAAVFQLKDHEFILYETGKEFQKCSAIPVI